MPETATKADRISQRDQYQRTAAALATERSSFDAHWRELAQFLFPVRARFTLTDRNRGDRRNQSIIDSTAVFARLTLGAGMHSGLTNPARPWMKLSTPDPGLSKFGPVKEWLFDVTERMHSVFQLSNLYNALPLTYGDMGCFATAAMGVLEDPGGPGTPGDLFRCYPYPIGSYTLGMDNRGLVTTFVRHFVKTVGQLVQEFGGAGGQPIAQQGEAIDWSRFSQTVKNLYTEGKYEAAVNVTWIVQPNRGYDPNRFGAAGFPWSSCHFEKDTSDATAVLRESGFREFPILAPRWFASAEDTYGTDCPGMTALGDVKQLQVMQKRKGQAIEKMVNPPLVGPSSIRSQKVSLLPGDLTAVDEPGGRQMLRPIHETKPDLAAFVMDINEVQYRINQAFYKDLFLMISQDSQRGAQPVTAREIEERHEEKLTALGPVLESTIDELLDPLVDRVFGMMQRAGLIPPPPPDLEGVELKVEYTSMLAQAQKLAAIGQLDRYMQTTLAVGQVLPEAAMVLKTRDYMRAYGDGLGIDPSLLRGDDEIDAMQQQQAKAQQAQAQAEQIAQTAQAAKQLGDTKLDQGDTALTRILASAGASA